MAVATVTVSGPGGARRGVLPPAAVVRQCWSGTFQPIDSEPGRPYSLGRASPFRAALWRQIKMIRWKSVVVSTVALVLGAIAVTAPAWAQSSRPTVAILDLDYAAIQHWW